MCLGTLNCNDYIILMYFWKKKKKTTNKYKLKTRPKQHEMAGLNFLCLMHLVLELQYIQVLHIVSSIWYNFL